MKRIKFHDESGQYEVHIIPFIFKTIFCVFGLIIMIGIAIELPSSIRYDLKSVSYTHLTLPTTPYV